VVAVLVGGSGGIIYQQIRVGQGGRKFSILKFRTMLPHAEHGGVPMWAGEQDPRVTRVGRLLRRSRLDELPQLLNVLRGAMSIVGPRPERPEFAQILENS